MPKFLLATILFFVLGFSTTNTFSQISIKGKLIDTLNYEFMEYTSVAALRAEDSILITHNRADAEGNFKLKLPQAGSYILLFSNPAFANLIDTWEVPDSGLDLGEINLVSKISLLEEFVVTSKRAITIKGDTTEYNADSFKVREFANVDELLRKLPGLEVDNKGNITAHGEKVQRMLVDGDEFFSDDPAVLSKMLRASAVDKIQVFDGKSETVQFTGVDDGERIKTINLSLKDNAKTGYFGKVELGGGLPEYWENQAMINAFKDKRKFSAFGIMSNTNRIGLSWDDKNNYGESTQGTYNEEDRSYTYNYTSNSSDGFDSWGGEFGGQGLPKTLNGGIHYNDKYGEDDQHEFSSSYRINQNNLSATINSRDQYILPDTQYVNVTSRDRLNSNFGQSINARAKITIDSTSDIVIRANANHRITQSNSNEISSYSNWNGDKINESTRQNDNRNTALNSFMELNYRKKFKKTGRTFTGTVEFNGAKNKGEGTFYSRNDYFGSAPDLVYDQLKENESNNLFFKARVGYTEPIAKDWILSTNASTSINDNANKQYSFDKTAANPEGILNEIFSTDYRFRILTNAGGANLRYNFDKYTFAFGGNISHANFRQDDRMRNNSRSYSFTNFFPSVSFRTTQHRANNFSFNYNGATNQPTLDQLQPFQVNTDPLNIRIGNPDLKQEFRHNVRLQYSKYEMLKDRFVYIGANGGYTTDAISSEQNLNELGVRTYKAVNVDGNFNSNIWSGFSTKIKSIDTRLSINLNGGYNRMNSIINNLLTTTTNYNFGGSIGADYSKDTTLFFNIDIAPSYNVNKTQYSSVQTNFLQLRNTMDFSYTFPKQFTIGTNVNWLLREKTNPTDNANNIFIWNAYLSKKLLKDRSLEIKLSGNDILNQNLGFQYFTFNNTISETQYNNIRRYFMLSVTWNFTKSKALSGDTGLKTIEENTEEASTDPDDYTE